MPDISGANKLLDKFKSQIKSSKLEDARETLTDLKVKLVDFTALPPLLQNTSTKDQELMLARDMLERSVLLAVQLQVRPPCIRLVHPSRCAMTCVAPLLFTQLLLVLSLTLQTA